MSTLTNILRRVSGSVLGLVVGSVDSQVISYVVD